MTTEDFIKRGISVHGDEYSYERTNFVDWDTKVTVTCKLHGDFEISPRLFIYRKHGCQKCRGRHISESKMLSQDEFLEKAKEVHGDRYDYSRSIYKGADKKVEILCKKHGSFYQTPYNHIGKKCGCPICNYEELSKKYRFDTKELLERFREKHGDKYKYVSIEDEYVNNRSKITIVCPTHGEFKQSVMKHLFGQGCPICSESILEKEVRLLLESNGIEYVREKEFDWLKHNKPLRLDFYLPKYNIAIECQGEQHYIPIEHFGGEDEFKSTVERDKIKKEACFLNNVELLFYTNCKNKEDGNIYYNKDDLLKEILNYDNN